MEETETDIEVLLECLKCQRNDAIGLKRTLSTLLSILGSDENTQEYFRESGGLHDVQNLFSQSISTEVQQAAMLCLACAVENNVFSQNALVNAETFSYLHQCLSEKHSRQYIQTASYFLMCLVTNNSVGQNLARESSCLSDALLLFRQCSEVNRMTHDSYEEVLLLWTSLTAALNGCVNNPQNEANQRLCSTILPLCFKIIAEENHHELCGPLLLFVGLTVSGNKLNQDRVRQSGGLDTMLNHLQKSLNRLDLGWRDEQHVLLISNALSSSMTDNERNIHFFLEHGGLHVLFSLLESLDMACDGVLGVVIAIGHVLEFAENRFAALTSKEQGKLIKLLTETQSEELVHAIKYVLSQCQELADGAENKEEEQTKIRSKIDELLAKIQHTEEMECLDDGQTLCRKGETAELRQSKDSLSNHLQGPSSNAQGQSVMSRIHQLCNEHGKSLAETLHGADLEWAAFQYFKQVMSEKCPLFDQKEGDASHVSIMLQRDGCKNSEYARSLSHQQPNVNDQTAKCRSKVMKSNIIRECGSCRQIKSNGMINEEKLCNEKDKNSMSGKISVSDDHAKSEHSCSSENTGQTRPYCSRDLVQEENRPSNSKVYRNPKCRCSINLDGCVINRTTTKCIYHDGEARADTDTQILENNLCLEDHSQKVCCFVDIAKNYTGFEKEQTFHKVMNCRSKKTDLTDVKSLSGKCPHQATKEIPRCIHTKMRNKANALSPHCITGYLVSSIGNSETEAVLNACKCAVNHTGKHVYLRDESQPCDEESTFYKCCKWHKSSRELGCLKQKNPHESSRIHTPCKESEAAGSAEIGLLQKLSHRRFQSNNECSVYLMNPGCRIDSHHFVPETCITPQGDRRKGVQNASCPCSCRESQPNTTSIRGKLDVSNSNFESSGTSGTAQDGEAQDGLIVSISEEKKASPINNKSYASNHGTENPQTTGQTHLTHEEIQNSIYFTEPDGGDADIQIGCLLPKFKSRIQKTERDSINKKNLLRKATCSDVNVSYPVYNNNGTGRAERKEEHERGTATETGDHKVRSSVDLPSLLKMQAESPAHSEFDIALFRATAATRKTDSKSAGTKTGLGSILDVRRPAVRPSPKCSAMDVGHDSFFRDSDRDSQPMMWAHGSETRHEWSTHDAECETRSMSEGSATSPLGSKNGSGLKTTRRDNTDGIPTDDKNTGETADTSDTSEVYSILEDSPGMRQLVQHVKERKEQKCPGCCPSESSLALNSRRFNIVLETSSQTCQGHRNIRQAERDFILKRSIRFPAQNKLSYRVWKKKRREREEPSQSLEKETLDSLMQNHYRVCSPSVYNFSSSDSSESGKIMVSPPSRSLISSKDRQKHFLGESLRRQRVAYSEEELKWLVDGVKTMGTRWRQIRHTYPFHPSRTPADLKEKYQRIKDSQRSTSGQKVLTHSSTRSLPLSMCEIRRLKRGVATIGHNWATILRSHRFAPGRTAEELREKWRVMNRKKHM